MQKDRRARPGLCTARGESAGSPSSNTQPSANSGAAQAFVRVSAAAQLSFMAFIEEAAISSSLMKLTQPAPSFAVKARALGP